LITIKKDSEVKDNAINSQDVVN